MTFATPELEAIAERTLAARTPLEMLRLVRERRRATAGREPHEPCSRLKVALLSAYTAHPFVEFLEQQLFARGHCAELYVGNYDSYMSLLLDPASPARAARPDFVVVLPSDRRCRYVGSLLDPPEAQRAQAVAVAGEVLAACAAFHSATGAEIILGNFRPPSELSLGGARTRYAGTDWTFTRLVNIELGLRAPPYVRVCDLEFLAYRLGHLRADDPRGWFESKQLGSAEFQVQVSAECATLVHRARRPAKKVLALDLDNTLWGGVLAEVGPDGIDLGDTSPIGEAFKAFQRYILALAERGVLLAVVSKNRDEVARQPFVDHPEMVLREHHVAAWRASFGSKADGLKQIAEELNLGLDSFVFVDDNPAEIAIVEQFAPEVETVLLGSDPSEYVRQLDERRFFEVEGVTVEDTMRTAQYRADVGRRASSTTITNMDEYLASLEMTIQLRPFCAEDVPRLTQLINKSNQFNLTTRRRTQAEVEALVGAPAARGFSVRLADRFGDHGLISIAVLDLSGEAAEIDTWLMSCRVLERQVEVEVLGEIVRLALEHGKDRIVGRYIPTAKNVLVKDLLPGLGFTPAGLARQGETAVYELDARSYVITARPTRIARAGTPRVQ